MKKIFFCFMVLLLIFTIGFSGCSNLQNSSTNYTLSILQGNLSTPEEVGVLTRLRQLLVQIP